MFRDILIQGLTDEIELSNLQTAPGVAVVRKLAEAKAIRLNQDAMDLIQHYRYEVEKTGFGEFAKGMRVSWPNLWLEHGAESGAKLGYHIRDEGPKYLLTRYELLPSGSLLPPLFKVEVDKGTWIGVILKLANFYNFDLRTSEKWRELEQEVQLQARSCTDTLLDVGIMCSILAANGVMRIERDQPPTRQQRRRAEREGTILPVSRVCRVDLEELGRRDLQLRNGEAQDDGERGKVRTHWVRGHMFLARNGLMTYRRPHLRGTGEMVSSTLDMTSSRQAELNQL